MEIAKLREVLLNTAALKPKEINLPKLTECLKSVQPSLPVDTCAGKDPLWQTSFQYLAILTEFACNGLIDVQSGEGENEEVINLQHLAWFIATADIVRQFTLQLYLPRELRGLSKCEAQLMVIVDANETARRLSHCVAQYEILFQKRMLAHHPKMEDCAIDFIAGKYSLNGSFDTDVDLFPAELTFRCLLIMKGSTGLARELAEVLHRDLLRMTGRKGGFAVLCRTLLTSSESKEEETSWRKSEVIARIVACRGHTKQFYRQVLQDCLEFFQWAANAGTQEALVYAGTCIECLKRFIALPNAYRELHMRIENHLFSSFDALINPPELVAGYVLCERKQLLASLHDCHVAFSGSSFSSLPSSLLVPYISLFAKLHSLMPIEFEEREYLANMTVFCLSNRSKQELRQSLVDLSYMTDNAQGGRTKFMHPRIIKKDAELSYSLVVSTARDNDEAELTGLLTVVIEMLKSSNRNLVLYDVFIILLSELMNPSNPLDDKRILDDDEQQNVLRNQFYQKYTIMQSLMELINHKHFHSQLYDNPAEVLALLKDSVAKAIDRRTDMEASDDDVLQIIVSLFQEFLVKTRSQAEAHDIFKLLRRYRISTRCSRELGERIDTLCNKPPTVSESEVLSDSSFSNAFSLCSDPEPYCKVYGTTLLLKLLKEKDKETVAQRHSVLILALANLRNEESYAFLNSVRLLVALCVVLEADVIDSLMKEYLSESNELDYRLKVGEATVKTVETLGPFAIRYRDVLLNGFLTGARHRLDEIRASSLANVGNISRILSYQVHHYFYELFLVISLIIETDKYLPARRAGILVLAQLIEGMDGLMDFQEYLLPIYRFLKQVINTDKDDVTKLQAAVALDHLKAKTKDFLTINPQDLEHRMFGKIIP
ncbi:transport and Golgi organization protein 6-like [Anopheles albimanus]|uniref:transport and Golgi organization protein 6-like n=1 Tax=Anopheles albimanus TaxID=7167 RepID=UPI00163E929C|nr:transport and Golgi organization protein 6-like [Anopheles albimanus]